MCLHWRQQLTILFATTNLNSSPYEEIILVLDRGRHRYCVRCFLRAEAGDSYDHLFDRRRFHHFDEQKVVEDVHQEEHQRDGGGIHRFNERVAEQEEVVEEVRGRRVLTERFADRVSVGDAVRSSGV